MSKQSFESFIVEFKGGRENVINIIKIVLEQNKVKSIKLRSKNSRKFWRLRKRKIKAT